MRLTKNLEEYLQGRDFYNLFEIANTIADYKEGKHQDNREISEEIWDLATKYVNKNEMYLEDEEWTWKWDEDKDDKMTIYDKISELYDYIQDADYLEKEYILEELANIQQYAK